ncbi:hypothetical protein Pcinc_032651 [Petrolisthes cinctipes]|uniref:Uncharacterized protein n=1 Tax=Petrolisthes cinctipes TaxID=88211 RepID=A0AAE1K322_PETCI|nr:hypothetical protein Pcinc_032651 [Petrolisthes cinctipes]
MLQFLCGGKGCHGGKSSSVFPYTSCLPTTPLVFPLHLLLLLLSPYTSRLPPTPLTSSSRASCRMLGAKRCWPIPREELKLRVWLSPRPS